MGAILTLPFSLVSKGVTTLINRGIYYCVTYIISYSYLWLSLKLKKQRLNVYDVSVQHDPEKLGLFIPKEEWALEVPQKNSFLAENADDSCCFGVNSSSEFLFVCISRKPNSEVHCSLLLRLANGNVYVLPEEHVIQKETEELHTFGSARLKMECLLPMRRWRIFFNGSLWEKPGNYEHSFQVKHVKFAFFWVASSPIHDYRMDFSVPLLAHTASHQKTEMKNPILFMEKVKEICDGYAQSGMIFGTVEVQDEPVKEVYLWGNKSRTLGKNSDFEDGRFSELYLNAENGIFIYLKTLNLPHTVTNYHYGYVMQANSCIYPIDECHFKDKENSEEIICHSGGIIYKIDIEPEDTGHNFQNHLYGETCTKAVTAQINGKIGRGIRSDGTIRKHSKVPVVSNVLEPGRVSLTLAMHDPICQNSSLTGGKGSSLAKLYAMSMEIKNGLFQTDKFQVPTGVVVTTAAYEQFIAGSLKDNLRSFEKAVWNDTSGDYSYLCEGVMKKVVDTHLPESIVKSLDHALRKVFGNDFSGIRFAVRSSATGEDTEQLSAAGQMDTFLGVKGFHEVLEALKRCWASQFSFVAVQYKRRYGQLLNTPMAVVIQKMIPCDAAGVLFTCDPVNGNPAFITISANYGLGESVVAASAEPDTIKLQRTLKNELEIHSKQIGSKKSKVVMTGSDGVENVDLGPDETSVCCLSDDMCLKLAKVAIKVEMEYGSPRDIEWGILHDELFLLQARPITSISTETDFEIKHAYDTFIRCENEYISKANIGEVMCGSASYLGLDLMSKLMFISYLRNRFILEMLYESDHMPPYYPMGGVQICGHSFFSLCDAFFRFGDNEESSNNITKVMNVSVFGRVLEDEKLFQMAKDRHSTTKRKLSFRTKIIGFLIMYLAGYKNQIIKKKLSKFKISIKKNTAQDIFNLIVHHIQHGDIPYISHIECSVSSSFWNMHALTQLAAQEGDYSNGVFSEFGNLLSSCTQVESADVPSAIQKLGLEISKCIKPTDFKKMSVEEALHWLLSTDSDAGVQFREFLSSHGHRGIREFDVYAITWGLDAKPLVKMLQASVSEFESRIAESNTRNTSIDISKLNIKLSFYSRLKLKYFLWNCRRCVRERECSKSVVVKEVHKWREVCRCLAKAMVKEGRLPNEELLYFLCIEEIRQLLKSRSPKLVSLAFRRWKCNSELDKLIFPEMCSGIPKPYNITDDIPVSEGDLVMTGVPVSQGVVTARACVILSVQEASAIQAGDVLITYGTDIGWSPYFPLLSGVVTELGGLISHGAVVAREYGLPCVVSLHGAVRKFKTGDLVHLDGNKGVLRRLKTKDEV